MKNSFSQNLPWQKLAYLLLFINVYTPKNVTGVNILLIFGERQETKNLGYVSYYENN